MATVTEIASFYGPGQCLDCVNALCEKFDGLVLIIDIREITSSKRAFIMNISKSPNNAISSTGLHYAFLFQGAVYDNLYHSGVNKGVWLDSFSYLDSKGQEVIIPSDFIKELTIKEFRKFT
ncbi:papain fold toxin domain-containing protein [Vibrio alginolyticus]|uniref:papain fold toxin domain-containing protein n=1 Tax=Vibrio diabolicus TaxID=50719 RepID=UPI002808D939|nr:hypothetical protein [Vibrio alginolyticus]ELA6794455.1 hypothetical protein [Vibrio alginolyticus]ELA8378415.1 hypothetical protein [Vibrio alginolyticus]ELA9732640.1 hypothetical protein [Vibrio alginolyticus]ELB2817757.1 hypothetical protein [Vibrio alginolyticus]